MKFEKRTSKLFFLARDLTIYFNVTHNIQKWKYLQLSKHALVQIMHKITHKIMYRENINSI